MLHGVNISHEIDTQSQEGGRSKYCWTTAVSCRVAVDVYSRWHVYTLPDCTAALPCNDFPNILYSIQASHFYRVVPGPMSYPRTIFLNLASAISSKPKVPHFDKRLANHTKSNGWSEKLHKVYGNIILQSYVTESCGFLWLTVAKLWCCQLCAVFIFGPPISSKSSTSCKAYIQ